MAKVITPLGSIEGTSNVPTFPVELKVYAGAVGSIPEGALVIIDGNHSGYVTHAADACDSTTVNFGVALAQSTDTVAAAGTVLVACPKYLLVHVFAKTPANLTPAMLNLNYILDLTSDDYTLDQGTTSNGILRLLSYDNTTNGLCTAILTTGL